MADIPALKVNDQITAENGAAAYRIIRSLGKGGVGRVYLAEDLGGTGEAGAGEQVVLKVPLQWDYTYDVVQEARYLLPLVEQQPKHVAMVKNVRYGFARNDPLAVPYLVMDAYVTSMAAHLQDVRSVDRGTALRWTRQIALGLQTTKLLHRDLKPENILLDAKLDAYVSDFGLAIPANPYTRKKNGYPAATGLMGTAAYMSPEQIAEAESIDHRSDIYALGLLLYEMMVGATAHPRKTASQSADDYLDHLLDYQVTWKDVPDKAIAQIVQRSTVKFRSDRYPDYWILLQDIEEAMKA